MRPLTETHSGPSSVLVDELDPGVFKRAPYYVQGCAPGLICTSFQLSNRHDANTSP